MGVGARERSLMDGSVRKRLMAVEDSLLGCRVGMVHCDVRARLLGLLEVVGNKSTGESIENHWDVLSKDGGCHMDCSCRWSRLSLRRLVRTQYASCGNPGRETHVVSRAPFPPFCDLGVWLPRELLDRRHQQRLLSPQRIVRDSCFDCDFGCRVDGRPRKRTSLAAVYRAFGSRRARCKSDHHRTLLKQVHLLCFHAYYGCAQ